MRSFGLVLWAILAAVPSASAAARSDEVTRWNVGSWTIWRVETGLVRRLAREYPEIRFRPGDRVLVDAGGCLARATLSVVLNWSGGTAAEPATYTPRPERLDEGDGDDPEALIEELIEGLTPAQRTALALAEPRAEATLDEIPVKLERGPPTSTGAQAAFAPSVRAVPDPARAAEDLRRLDALVKALGGALPGPLRDLPRLLEERKPE